jgi:serine protease
VGPEGTLAPYSSYGKELDIAAPGGDKRKGDQNGIIQNTIDPKNPARSVYASYQGTSMATPHVAAVAALLYAAGASGPDEVEKALFEGAKRVNNEAWSEQYGHGLLNAKGSLEALNGGEIGGQWPSLWWALALLALVLMTLGRRARPGYLNILLTPSFVVPLLLATVGVFFARSFFGGASGTAGDVVNAVSLPIPDWQRIIFGRGKLANPLFYSAIIPTVLSVLAIKFKGLRPAIGGLAIGFAGFLGYAAWSKAPGLAYMPFTFLAMPWLVVNTLVCVFIARAMLKKDTV